MAARVENSTVSEKGQTTIPVAVRRFLHIESGDCVVYEVKNNQIILKKAANIDYDWAQSLEATLNEWEGSEDDDL
jgi:AbrB family looped-hinge helix DNA binding protein